MTNNKAREINSPVIKQLLDETTPEELAKIDTEMTNNKQQTAVEWFLDQLIEHRIIIVDKTTYQVKYKHEILLEQAKEMEKELTIRFALFYAYGQDNVSEQLRAKIEKWYDKIFEEGEQ